MGNLTNVMSIVADEIRTMNEARDNFIKGIQDMVKQGADETRQFITNFRNDMNGAHEAFFGRKTSRKR